MNVKAIVATIEERGCCVVPEFLSSQSLQQLRDRLDELNRLEPTTESAVLDADRINIRVRTIVNKGEIFELLV